MNLYFVCVLTCFTCTLFAAEAPLPTEAEQKRCTVEEMLVPKNTRETEPWKTIWHGDSAHFQTLLEDDALDVNARDENGITPLMIAAVTNRPQFITYLIAAGADPNIQDADGNTVMAYARNKKAVGEALALGEQKKKLLEQLWTDVKKRDRKNIYKLLPQFDSVFLSIKQKGNLFLSHALLLADADLIMALILKGVSVNVKDEVGLTPLMVAVYAGDGDLASLLVNMKADLEMQDSGGMTALAHAAMLGHKEIADMLIAHNAAVDSRDEQGNTPLMNAVANKHGKLAVLLIQKGAAINAQNKAGTTPLMMASHVQAPEIAALLVRLGADVTAQDTTGKDAIGYADTVAKKRAIKNAIERGMGKGGSPLPSSEEEKLTEERKSSPKKKH